MHQRGKLIFIIALVVLLVSAFYFNKNSLFSPKSKEITFATGDSYTQEEIDKTFEISEEEYLRFIQESATSSLEGEDGGGEGGKVGGGSELIYSVGCSFYNGPQGPPPGFTPPKTQTAPDSCFWDALMDAKAIQFGLTLSLAQKKKILDEAKASGMYQNPISGGLGTPGYPPLTPAQKSRYNDLLNFIDNSIILLGRPAGGGGGGGGGWASDTTHVITPGWFGAANKAMLLASSKKGNSMIISWICPGSNTGHAQRVLPNGVTPNPACTSTQFRLDNPAVTIEVDSNGGVTSSNPAGAISCPPPAGGGPAPNAQVVQITIVNSVTNPSGGGPYPPL